MHRLHPHCLLSCLSVRVVFWHDALSFGSWETRNISTSLCQTPAASQDEALWWPIWQWQTDNDWMLHFTSLTFFLKMHLLSQIVCWAGEKEDKGWLRGRRKKNPPRTFYMKTHWSVRQTSQYKFAQFSRKNSLAPVGGRASLYGVCIFSPSMYRSDFCPLSKYTHLRLG